MNEAELRQFLANQDKELKDLITKPQAELRARMLALEQHVVSHGPGGSSSQEAIGEKAPIDLKSGLPVLSQKHKVIDNLPATIEHKGLDLSKFLRGCVTGSWQGAMEERKTLDETTNPSGGYLLVPELSAAFIDVMRAQTQCIAAGALTVPMSTSQLRIPVLNTDVTTGWKAELTTAAAAAPDFGQVLAQAHTLCGLAPLMSVELFEDSDLATRMITQAFARSMAVAVDAAALTGTGAPGPTGLKSNAAVPQTSVAAGPLSWDEISLGIASVRSRNYEPNSFILAPWGAGELARQKAVSAGSYLGPPNDAAELGEFVTTSAGSDVYLGDFSRMTFFPRTSVTIEISRVGDGTAWQKLGISIRAYLRMDVTATEPKAFQILVGYTS